MSRSVNIRFQLIESFQANVYLTNLVSFFLFLFLIFIIFIQGNGRKCSVVKWKKTAISFPVSCHITLVINQIFMSLDIGETSKMAMEAAPTSPQLTNYAAQNTATVTHTVPASHTTVNLIQPDQGKGLYIVDPSQQHALQMFGSPDQRTFMANPVEFNPTAGTITTTAVSNGNGQITMVSTVK